MRRFIRGIQGIGRASWQTLLILGRTIGKIVRHFACGVIQSPGFLWRRLFWAWWLGYGERPNRVLAVAILILVGTWVLYWQLGTFIDPDKGITGQPTWQNALYYSLVSFTALGYGNWAPQPIGWAGWVGAAESFLGIFSVVFFSITLTLRITR